MCNKYSILIPVRYGIFYPELKLFVFSDTNHESCASAQIIGENVGQRKQEHIFMNDDSVSAAGS